MDTFKKDLPDGFSSPTALPAGADQASAWQQANRSWWEMHPMRYDWKDPVAAPELSREFFDEVDRRFFADAAEYLPPRRLPFDRLIPFDDLRGLDVLEIGVGAGSHAELLARNSRSFCGIDLTGNAVATTSARMETLGLPARILTMDAERMGFADDSFDFIWSWGVIHHSSDTRAILREIRRVLRPGGRAVVMVYHRNFWNYYVGAGLLHGFVRGLRRHYKSLHEILQVTTDGGLARYYTRNEWTSLASEFLSVDGIEIHGSKQHLVLMPNGKLKRFLVRTLPSWLGRWFSHRLLMGTFLVARMSRPAGT